MNERKKCSQASYRDRMRVEKKLIGYLKSFVDNMLDHNNYSNPYIQ